MAFYGVGDGWCFSCGGFAGHVKLTFGRGTSLTPVPPVTPIGMGKDSRGVDLESVDDIDERQLASWMKQATAIPGFGESARDRILSYSTSERVHLHSQTAPTSGSSWSATCSKPSDTSTPVDAFGPGSVCAMT